MNASSISAIVISFVFATTAHGQMLGDPANGARIHESICVGCHIGNFGGDGSKIYLREDRRIKTVEGLMAQVEFCNRQIKGHLNDDEINDVIIYLNDNFYKFE